MTKDIAPELIGKIMADFKKRVKQSSKITALEAKIAQGTATYKQAQEYAILMGDLMSKSLFENLTAGILPDGKMYYNIAQRVLQEALGKNGAYGMVSKYCDEAQQILNQREKVGIKAITPRLNQDRVDGIVDIVSGKNDFEAIKYMLKEPIVNFAQSIVDEAVRTNADFQYKAGLSPQIVRTSTGNCCEWCDNLAGKYDYEKVSATGNDVWRRHKNCRCLVEYSLGNGKKQNTHTKMWTDEAELEKRKNIGLETQLKKNPHELEKTLRKSKKLTNDEEHALKRYISSDSYKINDKLRNEPKLTPDEERFKENLDAALKKMPNYSGNLQRSIDFPNTKSREAFLQGYRIDDTITYKEFISTTKGDIYNPDADVQIYIENSRRGKDISAYNEGEQEVLYSRNSSFKVKHIVLKNGITYILLEEK